MDREQEAAGWPCPLCTFQNNDALNFCEVCDGPRGSPKPSAEHSTSDDEPQENYSSEDDDFIEDKYDDYPYGRRGGGGGGGGGGKKATKKKTSEAELPSLERLVVSGGEWNEKRVVQFKKRVAEFRARSRENKIMNIELCKPILVETLEYLKYTYSNGFNETGQPRGRGGKAYVRVKKVQLLFNEKTDIQCKPWTGEIQFGLKSMKDEMYDGSTSIYPMENTFIKTWAGGLKEDILFWLLLHEFMHLFPGCDVHDRAFFESVAQMAQNNPFLFSLYDQPSDNNSMKPS